MVQNPFFVKIHILVYAKMANIAVLGLLEVIRARVKVLLYADLENGRAKIHILTFISKKGRVQAQKCNFIKKIHSFIQIQTHSSGIHAIFMDFWARLVPKIALFENFGTKNHNFRQISHQNFRNNPFVFFFRQSQAGKQMQSFEEKPEGFPKTITTKLPKFANFSKITSCKQKYSQKYRYVKNGHL